MNLLFNVTDTSRASRSLGTADEAVAVPTRGRQVVDNAGGKYHRR